jgi:hypothetical protein
MEISTERAFQILDAYCKHGTRLMISGRISGEEAASIAEVTRVWPITESIMIKLFCDDDGKRKPASHPSCLWCNGPFPSLCSIER